MNDRPLVVTGPPGAGKSTVAPYIATALNYAHVDLDRAVELRLGRSVRDVFARDGEAAFRRVERALLEEHLRAPRTVIAVGGGALVDRTLRHTVLRASTVVSLDADVATLAARVSAHDDRPLLTNAGPTHLALAALLDARREGYAEAHVRFDTAHTAPHEIAAAAVALHARRPLVMPLGARTHRVEVAALAACGDALRTWLRSDASVMVTDRTVARLWTPHPHLPPTLTRVLLAPGEAHKNLAAVERIWRSALTRGADRSWTLLSLGGGVVSDLGGFAAATLLRGVAHVIVPTTLLAMVDASVGGKTGFDTSQGKNLIGAFHQPALVWIDPRFTTTQHVDDWRAGMAEAVKVAAVADAALLGQIEAYAAALATPPPRSGDDPYATLRGEVIRRAVQAKIDLVARDEREAGAREALNFGHTVGHAVEHASGYSLRHGHCVAIGMHAALALGVRLGVTPIALRDRISRVLSTLGLPERAKGLNARTVHAALRSDKKRRAGRVRFVLLRAEGAYEVRTVSDADVEAAVHVATE